MDASVEEVSFEESVETQIGDDSITSTVGIRKKNDNGWTPIPVPVPVTEPVPVELPRFEAPDINWGYVTVGVGVVVVVGGCFLFGPGALALVPAI